MALNFQCVDISSKDPKALADFYRSIGASVFVENDCYDGWSIGDPEKGGADWGGQELSFQDPDGNIILILKG